MPKKESSRAQKSTRPKTKKEASSEKERAATKILRAGKTSTRRIRKTRAARVEKTRITADIPPVVEALSSACLGICYINKDGSVEYCNQCFSNLTGLKLEDLAGEKIWENLVCLPGGDDIGLEDLVSKARESGSPVIREHLPVGTGKEEWTYWDVKLIPQNDADAKYSGMLLVIQETSESRPKAGMPALLKDCLRTGMQQVEPQGLLDNLVEIIRNFSRCSYVKIAVVGAGDLILRAETGTEPGLWDTELAINADDIGAIFRGQPDTAVACMTGQGSVYLEDISSVEDNLEGFFKELVVNLRNSYGIRSIAFIPIKTGEKFTGYIQLAHKKAGGIPVEIIEYVETVADQLILLLDRLALKEDVRRQRESLLRQMHERSAYLEALSERLKQEVSERKKRQEEMKQQRDLAVKLNGIEDMQSALQLCLDTAINAAGVDCGGIYLLDRQADELILQCASGLSEEYVANVARYGNTTEFYRLVTALQPVYLHLDKFDPPITSEYVKEGLKGAGLVPIVHNGQAMGCMNVASHNLDEIPASTRNALETIAAQIGSSIARIQGRKELAESVERYRALFTRSTNPILISDFDGRFLDGNDAALAFLECSREELQTMHVRDTLPPYLDEQWFEQHRKIWEQGGVVERDYYVWGKIKVMEMTYTPLQLGDSRILIGVGTDITERKKAEAALQKSEEKYRLHVNSVADVIFSFDAEINVLDVSPSVERLLGYKPEEVVGRRFADLNIASSETQNVALENIKSVLEGAKAENVLYQAIAKDGTNRYVEMSSAPLYSGDEVTGVISVVRDVTERELAQQALRKSEEQYRMLAENIMDTACLMDMDFRIKWISPSGEKLTGYTLEELKRLPISKRVTQASIEAARQELWPAALEAKEGRGEPGRVYTLTQEVFRKDGSTIWTDDKFIFIRDENGRAHTIFMVGRDVTQHRMMGMALADSESRYRSLVESGGAGIIMANIDGEITFVNDAYCRMTGYTKEELIGKPFVENIYADDRDRIYSVFKDALSGIQERPYLEFRVLHKDGQPVWLFTNPTETVVNGEIVGFCAILQDITEKKEIERALFESEARYRSLVESSGACIATVNMSGEINFVNDALCRITGYLKQEVLGKQFVEFVHDEDRENTIRLFAEAVTENKQHSLQFRLVCRDGKAKWFFTNPTAMAVDGQTAGFSAILQDITENRDKEEALRSSEEKYRSLVENAGEVIFIAQEGKIKFANQRAFELSHYSREELLSMPFIELVHPEDRAMVIERHARRIRGEETIPVYELRFLDRDGTTKWVELRTSRIQWEGRPATLNFITDINDRKEAERSRQESEDRYRLLAENSLDVIWTADMTGAITYVSPSIRYLVGRSSEEIMGLYRRGTLTPEVFGAAAEDMERFRNGIRMLVKDQSRTQSFEFSLKHPDGFSTWVDVKMSIMRDSAGQAAGILGVVRDITQQKKMTERLISTDRLASLGEMAGGLAHEVNNPLTAVMGFAYLLQQNPNLTDDVKKDVDAIYREGKRAADVIKSFLLFARAHKQERQAVFINDILEGVIRIRRHQMSKENIEVVSELADDLPAVQGDVSQLQQAFLNIVMNAEFFMYKSHKSGHLTLKSDFTDGKIVVKITDDGPGIPSDKLNRVFDPFYTTKEVGEGIGLGLSICHGIIKGHGGEIYAESSEGKGATFVIELPPSQQEKLI